MVQNRVVGVDEEERPPTIQLQLFHDHPDALKRKLTEEERLVEGTITISYTPSSVSKLVIELYVFCLAP